jgi:hypothetical protein
LIDLKAPLTFTNAFRFPLQDSAARREVIIGGLWLLLPFIGWLMNMGHRIIVVHKMQHGLYPWPSWTDWPVLLKHGFVTWVGMIYYYLPAIIFGYIGHILNYPWLYILSAVFFILASLAIPGYMSHYCKDFDYREIFNPIRALRRAFEGGKLYWWSWLIALSALTLSFLGLLIAGIGFLVTSVWFWQVAGYCFANTFTRTYNLRID